MKFTIVGSFFDTSGYSSHTRGLFNALSKVADVRLETTLVQGWERLCNDRELEGLKKADSKDRKKILISHPLYWKLQTNGEKCWAYCVWEGDTVPKYFISEMLNEEIEYIFVPSKHTADAIEKTLDTDIVGVLDCNKIMDKVKLIPHGVNLDLFYPKTKPTDTVFLVNKGWRNLEDRGGTQYAIQAYLEEFTDADNVSMICKVNPAYGIPDINSMLAKLTTKTTNLPKLFMDVNGYEYKGLVELYNRANVFVATTRAEAYGIPMIEAMACGLPVITTNFGGQIDFCNETNGWIVNGELTEIKHEIAYEGCSWLTPNIMEIRHAMRSAHADKELVKTKGLSAISTAQSNTWDKSALMIKELR